MRIVVTGASGFIGSSLVKTLVSRQHSVAEINRVGANGIFSDLNLLAKQDVQKIAIGIREFEPDIVFHLAANTSIDASWKSPYDFISENIALSENLLEAIKISGKIPLLVLMSSSAVYDDSDSRISETFRLAPSSPYAISKLSTEAIALRYLNTIVVRPFFTVGASRRGDIIDEWLSKIIEIKLSGLEGLLEVGDLSLERDYLDVEDSARLLIEIAEKGIPGEIYNLCSGISTRLYDICEILIEHVASGSKIEIKSKTILNSKSRKKVVGNNSKLKLLGIEPGNKLRESIKKIADQRKI